MAEVSVHSQPAGSAPDRFRAGAPNRVDEPNQVLGKLYQWRPYATRIVTYLLLTAGCVLALAPIAWGLLTALKVQSQIAAYPPVWWPSPFTLENFEWLLKRPEI
jgi:ABC-type glycerol-3-phosphate transport system permease component